jgi:hypothetical protein
MAYGKDADELLQSGDRSVEQVVADEGAKINNREETVVEKSKVTDGDPNPDVVDTSIDRPADGEVKVKETEGNTGVRAVVDHDETAQEVVDEGATEVEHPIEGNNGESEAEREAREAEEKRLKELEVKAE